MAGLIIQDRSRRQRRGIIKRRALPRGVHSDITPMVDIAFLLLIFYMVTTVFAQPQAMELNQPQGDGVVEVRCSDILEIRVAADGSAWWNQGCIAPDNLPRRLPMRPDSLQRFLRTANTANPRLVTILRIHREADYQQFVDLLDEIEQVERAINAATAGALGAPIAAPQPFSYRYAWDKWTDRDDRIVGDARLVHGGQTI